MKEVFEKKVRIPFSCILICLNQFKEETNEFNEMSIMDEGYDHQI